LQRPLRCLKPERRHRHFGKSASSILQALGLRQPRVFCQFRLVSSVSIGKQENIQSSRNFQKIAIKIVFHVQNAWGLVSLTVDIARLVLPSFLCVVFSVCFLNLGGHFELNETQQILKARNTKTSKLQPTKSIG